MIRLKDFTIISLQGVSCKIVANIPLFEKRELQLVAKN